MIEATGSSKTRKPKTRGYISICSSGFWNQSNQTTNSKLSQNKDMRDSGSEELLKTVRSLKRRLQSGAEHLNQLDIQTNEGSSLLMTKKPFDGLTRLSSAQKFFSRCFHIELIGFLGFFRGFEKGGLEFYRVLLGLYWIEDENLDIQLYFLRRYKVGGGVWGFLVPSQQVLGCLGHEILVFLSPKPALAMSTTERSAKQVPPLQGQNINTNKVTENSMPFAGIFQRTKNIQNIGP